MKIQNLLIIPHYNNPVGLINSVKSIGAEEWLDILIVDDGSSAKIDIDEVRRAKRFNGSIFFHFFRMNKGIERALNYGLQYAKSNGYIYFSRLDCGDLCSEDRFQLQQNFLDSNPCVGIVGSSVRFFYEAQTMFIKRFPKTNKEIQKCKYFNSPFSHPAVMIRVDLLNEVGFYSTDFHRAEDYEFFFRILYKSKGFNFQEVLVHAELNPKGISLTHRKAQIKARFRIQLKYFNYAKMQSYGGLLLSSIALIAPYRIVSFFKKMIFR